LSDAKAGLTDASKTVEDKAGLILTSLASAYGIFDDLNNALNAEIQKAKETLADAIAQAAALGVKEAFTTIAQPIASQVQYFSNEAIDLIFNAIDQARDFAQDTALPALEQAAQALTDGLANAQKEIETLKTEAQKLSNQIETLLNVLTDNPNLAFVTDYLKDLQERKKLVETELANLEKAYQTVQDNIEEIKKTLTQIKADESTLQQNGQFTVENLKEWIEDIADLFTLIAQQAADLQDLLKTSAEVAENLHNLNKDFVNDIGDEVNRLANLAKEQIDEAIKN
jgi:chromosome segregation ATPase